MVYLNKVPEHWPSVLGIDLETTGLDPFSGNVLSIAVSDGVDAWVFLHFHDVTPLRKMFADESILKIFHNAKFDLKWLFHVYNMEVHNIYDTMLAERVIEGGREYPVGLNDVIARRCGRMMDKEVRESFIDHPGFIEKPLTNGQLTYIVDDVLYLPAIREHQLEHEVSTYNLGRVVRLENETVSAVARLELGGFTFDIDLWYEQASEFERRIEDVNKQIRELIGDFTLRVPRKRKGEDVIVEYTADDINLGSPSQLKELLSQRFDYPVSSTKAEILKELSQGDGDIATFAGLLLELRKWNKRLGFDYPKFVHPVTGKIHPDFHQLGARTGRFSCSNPNMQQIPRPHPGEPNMRHLFRSDDDDHVIIRADYSQQEPRILAQLSGDPVMLEACNKEDVYIEFGKFLFNKDIEKGSDERFIAKTFVLAVGYGAGIDRLAAASGKSPEECQKIRNMIRGRFPVMVNFASKMDRMLSMYGFVQTAIGRRRYFTNPKNQFSQAVNTPVQGTAAEMFKMALVKVDKFLTEQIKRGRIDSNTRVWLLVHDEIEVHCHKKDLGFVSENVKRLMEEAGTEICPDVKHIAEVESGIRWDK